jgi:excisionase family DNA binding protein
MGTSDTSLLTVDGAAAYLRLGRTTMYRLLAEGSVPGRRIGKRWRFRKDELEQFASGVVRSDDSGEGSANATLSSGNARKN